MQNPLLEFRIAVDKASQSCDPSIRQAKRARQKVKTRIGNVNALRPLKFWWELLKTLDCISLLGMSFFRRTATVVMEKFINFWDRYLDLHPFAKE